jgi:hypothetical protein
MDNNRIVKPIGIRNIGNSKLRWEGDVIKDIVTYSGCSIHEGTLLHSKSQYTTVKHG